MKTDWLMAQLAGDHREQRQERVTAVEWLLAGVIKGYGTDQNSPKKSKAWGIL